jgi:transmembrane sensor
MSPARKVESQDLLLEQAAHWHLRQAEGELSSEERAAFESWLGASEQHRDVFRRVENAWRTVGEVASQPEMMALRGAAFETARRAGLARWTRMSPSVRHRMLGLAASLLIAVLGGALWWHLVPRSYETGLGERRVVLLSDGTHVSLDAATEVSVRYSRERRRLWLERGRAKFDVARDPLRPLSVTAHDRTVVATGTSFSVELLNDELRVVLYEGHVAVLEGDEGRINSRRAVQFAVADSALTPGYELIAPSAPGAPVHTNRVDPIRSLSWEAGQLVFDDEPLPIAVARMNRYTRTSLAIGDSVAEGMRVSGVFRAGDTTAFVDGITALLPLRAAEHGEGITLSADPARLSRYR